MINWFDMPTQGLSNGGQFEIKELTATENKVYQKDGEVYNKVTVNVEGGGGGGDFSTAEVTINISGEAAPLGGRTSAIINNELIIADVPTLNETENYSLNIALYKGVGTIEYLNDVYVSSSGLCEYDNDTGLLTVTGNCTLTVLPVELI